MSKWIPVTQGKTPNLGWSTQSNFSFTAEDTLAPLVTDELADALKDLLIIFARDDESGDYRLMALQSLQNGINVYVGTEGQWLGRHTPRIYSNHPFALVALNAKEANIYINQGAQDVHLEPEPEDVRLFEENGEFTSDFIQKFEQLQAYHRQQLVTQAQVNQLASYSLIEPWPLELNTGPDNSPEPIQGLYRINEEMLATLDAEASAELVRSGAMKIVYAQIMSTSRLIDLSRLYAYQRQLREAEYMRQQAVQVMNEQSTSLENSDDDDLFKF